VNRAILVLAWVSVSSSSVAIQGLSALLATFSCRTPWLNGETMEWGILACVHENRAMFETPMTSATGFDPWVPSGAMVVLNSPPRSTRVQTRPRGASLADRNIMKPEADAHTGGSMVDPLDLIRQFAVQTRLFNGG
jgi:hypothetical protein